MHDRSDQIRFQSFTLEKRDFIYLCSDIILDVNSGGTDSAVRTGRVQCVNVCLVCVWFHSFFSSFPFSGFARTDVPRQALEACLQHLEQIVTPLCGR